MNITQTLYTHRRTSTRDPYLSGEKGQNLASYWAATPLGRGRGDCRDACNYLAIYMKTTFSSGYATTFLIASTSIERRQKNNSTHIHPKLGAIVAKGNA